MSNNIILTGDRPTGSLHLGHYVGSLRKRVELQNTGKFDQFVMIADLQALTDNADNPEKISASQLPVVIDFWAEWCGPCRMISPIIDELAGEYEGRAVIGKCDVDNNDDIVGKFMVRNIPTIVFIKGGQVVDKQVGACTKADLVKKLEKLL